jgi:hypothetical protein
VVANLIISYDKLTEGLEIVANKLDVKELLKLPRINPSPLTLTRDDLLPEQIQWIENRLAKDREFIANFCNRLLG